MRRGGRARLKAHAWRACRLGRVSGVQIPPSPPPSPIIGRLLTSRPEFKRVSKDVSSPGRIPAYRDGDFALADSSVIRAVGCRPERGRASENQTNRCRFVGGPIRLTWMTGYFAMLIPMGCTTSWER